jgi:dihydroxyacetone kinase-like predicted kinase
MDMGAAIQRFLGRFEEFRALPSGEAFTIEITDREATAAAREYLEENKAQMTAGLPGVRTGHITYAARDSVFDDIEIKEGDYLALVGSKMCDTNDSLAAVTERLSEGLNLAEAEFVTIFCGADATEEDRATVESIFREKAGAYTEFNIIDGGQPVYYFIIGVE